ncbi:MAG: SDR family oxidoreductase [Anaerolineales bacterium]|jgi:NAD(P)-dependent dehydrogenase (short-subunit alcohol dehydrogenase family)
MELTGKIAAVTGAAHRVGRSIALLLAEKGCDLIIHYNRSKQKASETMALAQQLGVRAATAQADLSNHAGIEALFQSVDQNFGKLDLLVNSAAIMEAKDFLLTNQDDWDRTIDLNLKGTFFCIQLAAQRMRKQGTGAIVNISDVAGLMPWKRFPVHSISKAGVEMLTKVAARAFAPEIRVNAVAPGPVLKPPGYDQQRWDKITKKVPLQRGGSPSDVAEAVIFLFENEFITGETLIVDGGRTLV